MEPLNLLREFILNDRVNEIMISDDDVIMGEKKFPINAKTSFRILYDPAVKKETYEFYTIGSILYLMENDEDKHVDYVEKATTDRVQVVEMADKKDLLGYLNGEIPSSNSIDKLANFDLPKRVGDHDKSTQDQPLEKKSRPEDSNHSNSIDVSGIFETFNHSRPSTERTPNFDLSKCILHRGRSLEDHASGKRSRSEETRSSKFSDKSSKSRAPRGSNWHRRSRPEESRVKKEIKSEPVVGRKTPPIRDRLKTILKTENRKLDKVKRETSDEEYYVKQELVDNYEKEALWLRDPRLSSKFATTDDEPDSGPVPLTENANAYWKLIPIIIIPSGKPSIITMCNAQEILQSLKYVSIDEQIAAEIAAGSLRRFNSLVTRDKNDGRLPELYLLVDEPHKLERDDWNRVVGIFVVGKMWQFRDWPFSRYEIFSKFPLFLLKLAGDPRDKVMKNWPVEVIDVWKDDPRHNNAAIARFWRTVDQFLAKQGRWQC